MNLRRSHTTESIIALLPLYVAPASALFSDAGTVGGALISIAAAICGIAFFMNRRSTGDIVALGAPFLLLALCYVVSLAYKPSFAGFRHLVAVMSVLFLFWYYVKNGWAIRKNPVFLLGAFLASFLYLAPSLLKINQKNFDGGMAFYGIAMLLFLILGNKASTSKSATLFVLTFGIASSIYGYLINFRMLIVFGILTFALYILFSRARSVSRHPRIVLAAIGLSIVGFIFFYTNIENSPHLSSINEFLIETTNRSALSGRQILWPSIIASILENPLFGLGAGTLPSDIMTTDLSSHNYYLQVALQTGIIGLAIAIWCVSRAWRVLVGMGDQSAANALASSLLAVFIVHNATEVIMFQNALRVAIPAWIVVFIAMSTTMAARDLRLSARSSPPQNPRA